MAKNVLSDEHKRLLVQCLARCMTPSEAAEVVRVEYGVKITRQSAQAYDPTTVQGRHLSEDYMTLFWEERERYKKDLRAVPFRDQNVRIRELQQLYHRAKDRGDDGAARATLEQIAKEEGGSFTNRRELTGAGGAPLVPPDDKKRRLARQMLRKLVEGGKTEGEARAEIARLGIEERYLDDDL